MDKLSHEDAKLFYSIWLPLLDFVNQKYSILPAHPGFEAMSGKNAIEPEDAYAVSSVLWENPDREIDDYQLTTVTSSNCSEESHVVQEILNSWKKKITSRFFMVRHLRDEGTILIQADQNGQALNSASSVNGLLGDSTGHGAGDAGAGRVFLVRGIESNIEAMFPPEYFPLPLLVRATLIPFKDVIITDGIIQRYEFYMGKGIKKILNDAYMQAKWEKRVISKLCSHPLNTTDCD